MKRTGTFPFTAIIGQEDMKKALVLNVVNPRLGGVLIQGEKGTAKSTAVRALADLLPPRSCVVGCRFHDDPKDSANWCDECHEKYDGKEPEAELLPMKVVELPVSATEDRVVGTLDIEAAIREGKRSFETGILADANRNILYVDEINLLDDHVVDLLLDSAAMGINTVEREGISYSHPARFSLVGTMNPEEGDIRPQLLDRFALSVYVAGEKDLDKRAEVIKRRLRYEDDPEKFLAEWKDAQAEEVRRIERAIRYAASRGEALDRARRGRPPRRHRSDKNSGDHRRRRRAHGGNKGGHQGRGEARPAAPYASPSFRGAETELRGRRQGH